MISYIKIYGPPLLKAIKALEKIAVDMPEVCIMDNQIKLEFTLESDESQYCNANRQGRLMGLRSGKRLTPLRPVHGLYAEWKL